MQAGRSPVSLLGVHERLALPQSQEGVRPGDKPGKVELPPSPELHLV